MAKNKQDKCIDYDVHSKTYGFVHFDKFFRKGRKLRRKTEDLKEEELDLLYGDFENHWNALPLKLQSRFMKWLRQALQERQDKRNE